MINPKFKLRRFIRWLMGWPNEYQCYWSRRALAAEKELKRIQPKYKYEKMD